jgi:hypothetical protein
MHSVKNRFLMRMKNISGHLYRRNFFSITARDAVVLGACMLHEHSSLKAFWYLGANLRRVLSKRRQIMQRRRVSDEYMASWFAYLPVSHPAPKPTQRVLAKARAARSSMR